MGLAIRPFRSGRLVGVAANQGSGLEGVDCIVLHVLLSWFVDKNVVMAALKGTMIEEQAVECRPKEYQTASLLWWIVTCLESIFPVMLRWLLREFRITKRIKLSGCMKHVIVISILNLQ